MAAKRNQRRRETDRSGLEDGLGPRLRQARESRSIGLRELARRIGASPSLISQIETGKSVPSVSTLSAIVSELGLSANEIVFFESRDAAPATRPLRPPSTDERPPTAVSRLAAAADLVADGGDRSTPAQRSHNRRTILLDTGVVWQRLTAAADHDVDFLFVRYPPGAASTPPDALMRHNGREYGFVLSGRLLVSIGFDDHELEPGDSIAFESSEPHRLATIGDEPVEAIWFVVGRRQ